MRDRLFGRLMEEGLDPELGSGLQMTGVIVDEQAGLRGQVEPFEQ
jgi:hypothetical protein